MKILTRVSVLSLISVASAAAQSSGDFLDTLFSGEQRFDASHELLHHDDITVNRSGLSYSHKQGPWTIEANLGSTEYGIDYTDPVGATLSASRNERTWNGGLTLTREVSEKLSLTLGFTTYDGFIDYQSVWIAEYYDQFIGIAFPDSYRFADPGGLAFQTGFIWEDPYHLGTITVTFGLSEDTIVPAWSPEVDLLGNVVAESSIDELTTYSALIAWEKALNPSLKTRLTFRYTDITARDPRGQLTSQWAWALSDALTLRSHFGGAIEGNNFEAIFGGVELHYELTPNWSLSLAGRLYRDTGEIVAAGFNTAAPELKSSELSASVAWSNASTSVRLSAGFYETNFGPPNADNQFFADLYADRDFTLGRLAISHLF